MKIISQRYEDYVEQEFDRYVRSHRRALVQPPEQYRVLREMLAAIAPAEEKLSVLNMCAANGSLMSYLNQAFPHWRYVGVETVKRLVEDESVGQVLRDNIELYNCSIHEVGKRWPREFDVVVHWMRLMHFDDWHMHLENAVRAARPGGHVFVSALFNDANVDVVRVVCDYTIPACREGYCIQYNEFSMAGIERYCWSLGVQSVEFTAFELSFDIPRTVEGMGTYTVRTEEGRRLQISGGLLMPWKILHAVV